VKIERNVFSGLYRVNPADLHKPDLLHNIYLGLFKHMMKWVEGFLKKHKWQQAFDEVWKALPPYPGFMYQKRLIEKSRSGRARKCETLAAVFSSICIRFAKSGQLSAATFQAGITVHLLTD